MLGRNKTYWSMWRSEEGTRAPREIHAALVGCRKWPLTILFAALVGFLIFVASRPGSLREPHDWWNSSTSFAAPIAAAYDSKALVLSSYRAEDVSWLSSVPSEYVELLLPLFYQGLSGPLEVSAGALL